MTRVATPVNEECLLEQARYSTGSQLERICRLYATVQRHDADTTPSDDRMRRQLVRRELADGMVRIEATLHAEEAAAVWAAIERIAAERCRAAGTGSAEPPARGSRTGDPETASRELAEVLRSDHPVEYKSCEIASPDPSRAREIGGREPPVDHAASREHEEASTDHRAARGLASPRGFDEPAKLELAAREVGDRESELDRDHAWVSREHAGGPAEHAAASGSAEPPRSNHPAESAGHEMRSSESSRDIEIGGRETALGPEHAREHADVATELRAASGSAEPPRSNDPPESAGREISSSESSRDIEIGVRVSNRADGFDRAGALVELAQAVLRGTARERAPVDLVVTVSAETLALRRAVPCATASTNATCSPGPDVAEGDDATEVAVLGDGSCISAIAARRLGCDCGVIDVVEDERGVPLSIGRKRRTIPGSMKRALLRRDGTCRFPGCNARVFLEGHHIEHWADGGKTEMANIALLCSWHHRHCHEYGYTIHGNADREIRFVDPHGRELKDVPVRPIGPALGWATILAGNAELGITADTPACGFSGDPVDYVACIDDIVRADARRSS